MGWLERPCFGRFNPEKKNPVPIAQEVGWVPRLIWTGAKNLAATGIRSPDIASRYDGYAIPAHFQKKTVSKQS
jgi:hypothetical protein